MKGGGGGGDEGNGGFRLICWEKLKKGNFFGGLEGKGNSNGVGVSEVC